MNKKMNLNWSVDEITGNRPDISSMRSKEFQVKETSNTELLKDYLKRLGNGEDLESVKKDFVQNFSDVEASEIMKAEQELIKEGTAAAIFPFSSIITHLVYVLPASQPPKYFILLSFPATYAASTLLTSS